MSSYHVMVKPIGAVCNLDCTYCYYLHKKELLGSNSQFRISDEILESHIRQYIEGQDCDQVVFSWQGGERSPRRQRAKGMAVRNRAFERGQASGASSDPGCRRRKRRFSPGVSIV